MQTHFASEYFKLAGYHAEAAVISTLAQTFSAMWKVLKSKDLLYNRDKGKTWLETELVIKEPVPEIPVENPAAVTVTPQQKPRKLILILQ